ncbi:MULTISPECIES: 50S ribosomal protein L11 [Archaeoglobus]|jgi:large subunit ribosomal protein L11|uniref:Large ribosomal subunit protein uL11 n=3 Tax=Archaeoglobus fulgidus TaxID=2234 RepID=RL11_ARCFU|nr:MULTISPECIES: 50S ribosomal protein L11 [Archaeoglobus]O29712.1 RecName: Full=Large ribosomal subunit protein uL11; AltName: Full=50S ribosomal protein L11 [Archaeoglobus fulgidus DSM 4304]AAB90697.1 LSU ribosomal protein L11P (rpl11P) [Archaeoglobus fulgidus DSM 4304]AIG97355.1 Ribosomal protein L11 [Archaeoglobus fulgidus DSM 8774]KUJ93571.1 MAG: 50S ribosomal protein L11 [Archaeoglobus fulgidus]KUK07168.1 MAG: 50S ribosomal protein L11 [Archaeoglobus fulgidus]MDI3496942.1 large subunit 
MVQVVEVLVPGGQASPGPPLGPAIGPLGLNVKQVVDKINEATKDYEGLSVPVKIIVKDDRSFEIEVGIPPVSALIKRELGIEKGASNPGREVVGNLTMEQLLNIARIKRQQSLSYTLKEVVKEVLGTCNSMGITVEGKSPKELTRMIEEGQVEIPEE